MPFFNHKKTNNQKKEEIVKLHDFSFSLNLKNKHQAKNQDIIHLLWAVLDTKKKGIYVYACILSCIYPCVYKILAKTALM